MPVRTALTIALASTLLGAGITQAQQAPAPYPLDNVPDKTQKAHSEPSF